MKWGEGECVFAAWWFVATMDSWDSTCWSDAKASLVPGGLALRSCRRSFKRRFGLC